MRTRAIIARKTSPCAFPGVEIWLRDLLRGTVLEEPAPALWTKLPEDQVVIIPRPTMTLDLTASQSLMDQLWECGLRPSEGSGSAGAMAATQAHLRDLQCIVFKDFQL